MPLATLLGMGPNDLTGIAGFKPKVLPENTALIGIRSVDKLEREGVRKSGVTVFTMRDVEEKGLRNCMDRALEIAYKGTAGFELSYDVDGVYAFYAPDG